MLVRLATCGRYMLCSSDDKVDNFLLRNLETLKELQHLLQRQRQCDICVSVRKKWVSNPIVRTTPIAKQCKFVSFETKLSVRHGRPRAGTGEVSGEVCRSLFG